MSTLPPFDPRVEIAPGADRREPSVDHLYVDVSGRRRETGTPVEWSEGRGDESGDTDPLSGAVTLDNRDSELSHWDPESPVWGQMSSVPTRVRMPLWFDDFDRAASSPGWGTSSSGREWSASTLLATTGSAGTGTYAAANTATFVQLEGAGSPDVEVRFSMSCNVTTAGATMIVAPLLRWDGTPEHYLAVFYEFRPDGTISIKARRRAGSVSEELVEVFDAATYTPGSVVHCRAVLSGAEGRARCWADGDPEPDDWALVWSDATNQDTGVGFLLWRFPGETTAGSVVVTLDDVAFDALLLSGVGADAPPRWDHSGRDSTLLIELGGMMRVLEQQGTQLAAPLERQLARYGPVGFWPLSDGSGATRGGNAVPGGAAAVTGGGVSFGVDGAAGMGTAAKIDSAEAYLYAVADQPAPTEWAAMACIRNLSSVTTAGPVFEWRADGGTARSWQLWAEPGGFAMRIYDYDGILIDSSVFFATVVDVDSEWTAMQLEVVQNGGDVDWVMIWYGESDQVFYFIDGSFTGTLAADRGVQVFSVEPSSEHIDLEVGCVWMGAESLPFVDSTFRAVFAGYPGEEAGDRVARLCAEEGVPAAVWPGVSERLGVQRPGGLLDLLREATAADAGALLLERGGGLEWIPRRCRYNGSPVLTLDWAGGELGAAPLPAADDRSYVSRYTASRDGGGSATAELADAEVQRRGFRAGADSFALFEDQQLPDQASWRLAALSWDELRFPTVVLDLLAHPELIDQAVKVRPGARVRVQSPKVQLRGQTFDLVVEQVSVRVGRFEWTMVFACSPAGRWDVGEFDAADRLQGSSSTTLVGDHAAAATSLSLSTVLAGDVWSTSGVPYPVEIAGEEVTVTAMSAVAGSGPFTQTATVTRAANGVSKVLPDGSPVRVARRVLARYAL